MSSPQTVAGLSMLDYITDWLQPGQDDAEVSAIAKRIRRIEVEAANASRPDHPQDGYAYDGCNCPSCTALRATPPAQPLPTVEQIERALQELWRVRDSQDHFVYDIPVPPDRQTAAALHGVLSRLSEARDE